MNVAHPNPIGYPSSTDNQTPEQICQQIGQFADSIKAKVRDAADRGESFDSHEREVDRMIMRVGRQAG